MPASRPLVQMQKGRVSALAQLERQSCEALSGFARRLVYKDNKQTFRARFCVAGVRIFEGYSQDEEPGKEGDALLMLLAGDEQ